MKKFLPVILVSILLTLVVSACSGGVETTPLPTGSLPEASNPEQPDDIVNPTGSWAYRANVIEEGTENAWPPIETTKAILGDDKYIALFRSSIETKAGQVRTNIIHIGRGNVVPKENTELELYTLDLPSGIILKECANEVLFGPGSLVAIVTIEITGDVAPGTYTVKIGIKVDGKDYGRLPCTVIVTE